MLAAFNGARSCAHATGHRPGARRLASPRLTRLHATSPVASPAAASVAQLKQRIKQLAGRKAGHDLDAAAHQAVRAAVEQLEAQPSPSAPRPEEWMGSRWQLLYTTSTGTSSGKIGPFIAQVEQAFSPDEPGLYYNIPRLGLVNARLVGQAEVAADDPQRINVTFLTLGLFLGDLQVTSKEFQPRMQGWWRCSWTDGDFRVFYTNQGNLFVLSKQPEQQIPNWQLYLMHLFRVAG